jgi:hypothetical protein
MGVLCYFPRNVVLQKKQCVKGRNIDNIKVAIITEVQHFLIHAFKKFYIAIWFCMLIEDVMEVLILLLSHNFIEQFVFIWGHEQCSMTLDQFTTETYYCFKDLSCVGECMKKGASHTKVKAFSKDCIFHMVVFYWFILHFSHNF